MTTVLRCYKMMWDDGFAPNPENDILTLATCKAYMRKVAQKNEWIAGFTSKSLVNGQKAGEERLIYLMCIEDKIKFNDYYNNHGFMGRKDNIYFQKNGKYIQINNDYHNESNILSDTGISECVLISYENWYYFGYKNALSLECYKKAHPRIPSGPAPYGWLTKGDEADEFIKWVGRQATKGNNLVIQNSPISKCGCKK